MSKFDAMFPGVGTPCSDEEIAKEMATLAKANRGTGKEFEICWATQWPKYVLSRVFLTHECGWLWPDLLPFKLTRATMMNGAPPSIRPNVAVVNDETASASHRYGHCENGVSSSSVKHTI
jgi:hypothetical protein